MAFRSNLRPEQINKGLRNIRRRQLLVALMFLAFFPTVLLTLSVLVALGFDAERSALWTVVCYGAAWAVAGIVLWQSTCPRCYSAFFQFGAITNVAASKCGTCGLSLRDKSDV